MVDCRYRACDAADCPTRQTIGRRPLGSGEMLDELDRVYCTNLVTDCPMYEFLQQLKTVDVLKSLGIPHDPKTGKSKVEGSR